MKVGRVKNLDRLSLASLRLKSLTCVVFTISAGKEFHGWTTRLEKTYFAVLVLTREMDVEDFGRASLFCLVLSYRPSDDVTEYGTSSDFWFCVNVDDP